MSGPPGEHVGRTLPARQLEPFGREIDRDDALGSLQPAAGDGAEPDETGAEDDARRSRRHPGRVHCSAEPRRKAAGEDAGAIERRITGDLGERDLRHYGVLGKRRGAHEVPDRLSAGGEPRRAVGQEPFVLLLADREAEIRSGVEAVHAFATLRREERHDVIAAGDRGHALPDLFDDACSFVAEHGRRVARRIRAGRGVEIGVADPTGDEPDEHFSRLRLGKLDLLDLEWSAELTEDCSLDAHRRIMVEPWPRSDRSPRCATTFPIWRPWSPRPTTSSPMSSARSFASAVRTTSSA